MSSLKKVAKKAKKDQIVGAERDLIGQLFDDHYKFRWRVYQVNFVRGIFFGLGSIIGASVIVGLFIWILSAFTNLPFIGNYFQKTQNSIQQEQQNL